MKQVTTIVKFFITKNNMEYLLNGRVIDNFDEMRNNIFMNITSKGSVLVYQPRERDKYNNLNRSEYPDEKDRIVAKVLRYIKGDEEDALEIEIVDSLYYSKIYNPVIKLNGYCIYTDGGIHIEKITRITLANS